MVVLQWVVALVAAAMTVSAQTAPRRMTDAEMDGLSGKVHTVRVEVERVTGVLELLEESTYDLAGRLEARTVYEKGVAVTSSTFEHPSDSLRIETRRYAVAVPLTRLTPRAGRMPPRVFDATGAELFCRQVDFDAAGRPLAEATYPGREPKKTPAVGRYVYRFLNGRRSEAVVYGRFPEQQIRKETFVYDLAGKWTETIVYDPDYPSPEKRTWIDTNDATGNWTKRFDRRSRSGRLTTMSLRRTIVYY